MGRKKTEEAKPSSKDASKNKKFSVSAMLASMEEKPDKPKKVPSSSSKPKAKSAPKPSAYTDGIDLPPSDDEEDEDLLEEEQQQINESKRFSHQQRPDLKPLDVSVTDKELKMREKKDLLAAHAAEQAKQEALKDHHDAFTVVIGSRTSALDGDAGQVHTVEASCLEEDTSAKEY